jgi:hypothetical protein
MTAMTKILMEYDFHHVRKEKYVTLTEVAAWMRDGKYAKRVKAARGLDVIKTEAGYECGLAVGESLPFVRPAKGQKGSCTGLVLLSFRLAQGMETLRRLRQTVNLWEQTQMSFIGVDGQSLEVLIAYRLTGGGLPEDPTQQLLFQQHAFRRAAEYVVNATGVRPEDVRHDGSEGFYVSYDPQAYLNPQAHPIEMAQPTVDLQDAIVPVADEADGISLDAEMLPGYTRREIETVKFNFICRRLTFDGGRSLEDYLMKLATECRKAGIDQELAIKLLLDEGDNYGKEVMVRSTFENAYCKHRLGMANPIESSMMHQLLLEQFLKRRYIFRRNRVTGDVEYQEKYIYQLWWKPLTQEARNDINSAAIREGIKVWPKDLDRVLVSERIPTYDPVGEWLDKLPRWDGRDRLGELARRVTTATPCWEDDFRVWMRSMVSQWRAGRNAMYGAQMVLMLVGDQGTRKSTFMRMLLPPELMPYYIDRIDFANKKEALRALSRFLLINIDEYDQVSKAQTAFLKHLIQRTDVKERKLYSTTFEQQQRYAAFCATTNSLMPLKDESGSRRYLVVEVNTPIDADTQGERSIDYRQLYAQIVYDIENGEDYAFTGERERRIMERNGDYYDTPNIIERFNDHFRLPKEGEEVMLLSPTEIVERLKMDVSNHANVSLLGSYLRRKGFEKGYGVQRRRYKVVCYRD